MPTMPITLVENPDSIRTVPDPLTLHVQRVIRAKRQRVYEAWTNPELFTQWFGCSEKNKVATVTANVKVGGDYRIAMSGGCHAEVVGTYTEIIPNERLRFTWGWPDNPSPETIVTVEFKDVAGGTEVSIRHERFESQDVCDQHEQGWRDCLASLERYGAALGS